MILAGGSAEQIKGKQSNNEYLMYEKLQISPENNLLN